MDCDCNDPGCEVTITDSDPCPHCKAAEPTHYEVRIDDQLVGTCQGVDERGALIDFRPVSYCGADACCRELGDIGENYGTRK